MESSSQSSPSFAGSRMRGWWMLCAVLAIPIIPFLLWGSAIEAWLLAYREHPPAPWLIATLVMGLLTSDVLLPIPSSLLCTLAGSQLGMGPAILVTWMGMNLGAILGFAAARKWGVAWMKRQSSTSDLQSTALLVTKFGPTLLLLARGVPVLAEASVLWLGAHSLGWVNFLWPVVSGNLVLAILYCSLGEIAAQQEWLPIALVASLALPVALFALWRSWRV